MKWRLMAPVLAAVMLLCTVTSIAADSQYACADKSCTFNVPDSYSLASNDPSQIIFQDSVSGGSFSLAVQDGSKYNSLDDAVKDLVSQVSSANGYQADPAGVQSLTLAGNPAQSFSYFANNSSGTKIEQGVFSALYNGKLYLLI